MAWYNKFFNFKEVKQEKPVVSETAWASTTFIGVNGPKFETYNPDELVARKGSSVYKKMLRDPQVKSAFNLILDILSSRSYRFVKASDNPIQDEIIDLFYHNINTALRGNWPQSLRGILMSKAYGFSVTEKNFMVGQYNNKDYWMLKSLKPKPFNSFDFEQDVYGNIKSIIQTQGNKKKKLDPKKFIVHVNFPELDEIYGESDLRSAYRPYWEKDIILKLWSIYLERMAGGAIIVKPGDSAVALKSTELDKLDKILRNLSESPAIRLPQGWEADVLNSTNTDAYEKSVIHKDLQIAKALLVPNLLGYSEQSGTGSYAQSQTQFDIFMMVINNQSEALADALNEQLFRELAMWNFGTDEYPRIEFDKYSESQKQVIAEAWSNALKSGAVTSTEDDENKVRELLGFDIKLKDQNEEVDDENEEKQEITEEVEAEDGKQEIKEEDKKNDFAESNLSNDYFYRYNFADISKGFDDNESDFYIEISKAVDDSFNEISETIKQIITGLPDAPGEGSDTADVNKTDITNELSLLDDAITSLTKSELNKLIKKNLQKSYEDGRLLAQDVIKKALDGSDFSEADKNKINLRSKLSRRVTVKYKRNSENNWSVLDFSDGLKLDTAEKYFAAKAFEITGDLTQEMIDKAKQILLESIKNGLSVDETIEQLENVLPTIIGKRDPETGKIDKTERSRLETIVRTNLSDAFNQANLSVYSDPDLGDFVEAYEYSAILDSRTTDFCSSYNGRVFSKNDSIWRNITPPNHFNCRSILLSVTMLDKWRESDKAKSVNGDLLQPGKGFGIVR